MAGWDRRSLGLLPFQTAEDSTTAEGTFQYPAPKMGSVPKEDYGLLKWKDYHVTVASTFKMLKDEEDFLDVTLVCDEESQISAHKVFETPDHLEDHLSTSEIVGHAVGLFSLFPGDAPKVQKPSPGDII